MRWDLGQYYLLFGIQSVKRIDFLHPYVVFFDKDFVVRFFIGSFAVKTTRMFNNCYKSKRNFWASVQHINEHRWKAQHLFITNS